MDHDDAFLQDLLENPEDNTPRLVYADWLEERGDPRGAFLRLERALAACPEGEHPDALLCGQYLTLWSSLDPEWLQAVDRVSARLLPPTSSWEVYNRAESYSREGHKANMLCHLLIGLLGTPRDAALLSASDLKTALAEKRVLRFYTSRDGFGGGSVGVGRATPEDNVTNRRDGPWAFVNFVVLPCIITNEICDCLGSNWWEWSSECPFGL
jgi:uncharacterized protein (TIGR02996 family)